MANTVLNPTIIAKTAVRILENELVMGRQVYRGYEEEFDKKVNGYDVGDTISIRKPQQFSVRTGATAIIQDVTEGKFSLSGQPAERRRLSVQQRPNSRSRSRSSPIASSGRPWCGWPTKSMSP